MAHADLQRIQEEETSYEIMTRIDDFITTRPLKQEEYIPENMEWYLSTNGLVTVFAVPLLAKNDFSISEMDYQPTSGLTPK